MLITTKELEKRLNKILELQKHDGIDMPLFEELAEKAKAYKEMIVFLKEDDVEKYLRQEQEILDDEDLKKHTRG